MIVGSSITFQTTANCSTFTGTIISISEHSVFVKPDAIERFDGSMMEMVPVMIPKTAIVG